MKIRNHFLWAVGFLAPLFLTSVVLGEDVRYRLFSRDIIHISVHGEPDMTVDRRIDALGQANVPLLGQLAAAGHTVAELQGMIAKRYVDEEIFVHPEVVVSVVEYSLREIMVLGQVMNQGKKNFPPESTSMSIVEAITSAGGFTRLGKSDAVQVTRKSESGDTEQSFTVNVEKMLQGRGESRETFLLLPGDVVYVPERVF